MSRQARSMGKRSASLAVSGSETDIIQLILKDHEELKGLIAQMKSEKTETDEKMKAFDRFAPALVAHARPEEKTFYQRMKEIGDLRSEGFEGEVEHMIADQLMEEIKRTHDEDEWTAKVKVLAEVVEHHLQEEEKKMVPGFEKEIESDERENLGEKFLSLKKELVQQGSDEAPPEGMIEPAAS